MGLLDGKVAIVTGAGRGVGRGHALELARNGAKVVVNDLGGEWDGSGEDNRPASEVVEEIKALGGEGAANFDNVATWEGAENMVKQAVDTFGDLHILINNAGILRDRMAFNMDEAEWDAVVTVHGKGHFAPTRFACAHWRQKSKEAGGPVLGRLIHTSSESGLFGNAGQCNYDFAKAGLISFSLCIAREMTKYGVTSNVIAPRARTRMTEGTFGNIPKPEGFDRVGSGQRRAVGRLPVHRAGRAHLRPVLHSHRRRGASSSSSTTLCVRSTRATGGRSRSSSSKSAELFGDLPTSPQRRTPVSSGATG